MKYTCIYVWIKKRMINCLAQGALLKALWWPRWKGTTMWTSSDQRLWSCLVGQAQGCWHHCSHKRYGLHHEPALQPVLGSPEAATQKAALDLCSRGGRCLLQPRLQTEAARKDWKQERAQEVSKTSFARKELWTPAGGTRRGGGPSELEGWCVMQSYPASRHLSPLKSSVMCCGLFRGSALATSPNISSGFFSPPIWQCNRTDTWTVRRTNQRYSLLQKESRSSVCLGRAVETLVLF